MKRSMLFVALLGLISPVIANEEAKTDGFLIGIGGFTTGDSACYDCEGYTGGYVEIGYDFNEIVGIEAKTGRGDLDDYDMDMSFTYMGFNIGHDFNTDWFRFYGKVGYARIEEEESYFDYFYGADFNNVYRTSGLAFGFGARFTTTGRATGFYLKTEAFGMAYDDENAAAVVSLGLGYRF